VPREHVRWTCESDERHEASECSEEASGRRLACRLDAEQAGSEISAGWQSTRPSVRASVSGWLRATLRVRFQDDFQFDRHAHRQARNAYNKPS
jgi:hypothetical protein